MSSKTRLITLCRQEKIEKVKQLLHEYLSTPGEVRASEAFKRHGGSIVYPTFYTYFISIMKDLQEEGKAEPIYGGLWRIKDVAVSNP